jgi:HTH-type transcriptional regulator / antitoxin HigA
MEPRIIKTEAQYRAALAEVERLVTEDPVADSADGDRLELLAKLVEDYEKERYKFARPDPVEAILFRMGEQGLRQKDVATLLGGKNRASEVLARKRPLTLAMVRALSESLHIPAELLIRQPESPEYGEDEEHEIPMPYLVKSGWFEGEDARRLTTAAVVARYLKPRAGGPLYLRRTITYGATPDTNKTRLRLWVSKVRELAADSRRQRGPWRGDTLNEEFLFFVARLSGAEQGPRLAQKLLAEKGIALIVWPALPQTKLDGAAMLGADGAPIVGVTLRHDRLDSFWFTLLHELVHAWKHLPERDLAITDESVEDGHDDDSKEAEANRLARDAFIPRSLWKRTDAFLRPSVENIRALADRLNINPAIVAGRLRREKTGYAAFSALVGNRQVRKLFPEVKWG